MSNYYVTRVEAEILPMVTLLMLRDRTKPALLERKLKGKQWEFAFNVHPVSRETRILTITQVKERVACDSIGLI